MECYACRVTFGLGSGVVLSQESCCLCLVPFLPAGIHGKVSELTALGTSPRIRHSV